MFVTSGIVKSSIFCFVLQSLLFGKDDSNSFFERYGEQLSCKTFDSLLSRFFSSYETAIWQLFFKHLRLKFLIRANSKYLSCIKSLCRLIKNVHQCPSQEALKQSLIRISDQSQCAFLYPIFQLSDKKSDQSPSLEAYFKLSGKNIWPDFHDIKKLLPWIPPPPLFLLNCDRLISPRTVFEYLGG